MRGVVFKDDLLELVASDEELKRIYKNGQFYIDDKKYKYVIENVIKDAFSKNEETYNIVYLACKLSNEKEKDVVDLVFLDGKFYLFRIFELIWKGD
ncbi:MAG: hypothetical protein PUC82_03575 [bacterium]|nr:hypothetical protein [bacterium]